MQHGGSGDPATSGASRCLALALLETRLHLSAGLKLMDQQDTSTTPRGKLAISRASSARLAARCAWAGR